MLTKTQLKEQLNVSASKLESLIAQANIDPTTTTFTEEQALAIEEAATQPEAVRPRPVSRSVGLEKRQTSSPVKVNQRERNASIIAARAEAGNKLGQVAGVKEAEGFVKGWTEVTDPFYSRFNEVSEQQLIDIANLDESFEFGDYEGIAQKLADSFFVEGNDSEPIQGSGN